MKKYFAIILIFVSFSISAQYGTDELCSQLNEIKVLKDAEISELQTAVDNYYQDKFKDSPEISESFSELPKDWLKQSFLIGFAECYMQGKYVGKSIERAKSYLSLANDLGNKQSAHMLASIQLFKSTNFEEQQVGFKQLKKEYESGSAYAAGKLGWAYQRGLAVKPDISKAVELYNYAASSGMTYWQFLLAHAYKQGYLGLKKSSEKSEYWLNFEPKIHIGHYECWVTSYYEDGTFPKNEQELLHYRALCEGVKK